MHGAISEVRQAQNILEAAKLHRLWRLFLKGVECLAKQGPIYCVLHNLTRGYHEGDVFMLLERLVQLSQTFFREPTESGYKPLKVLVATANNLDCGELFDTIPTIRLGDKLESVGRSYKPNTTLPKMLQEVWTMRVALTLLLSFWDIGYPRTTLWVLY
jgi:hypothetical protein